jgi:hypothetical protein
MSVLPTHDMLFDMCVQVVERGCALLGFAALGNVGMLLLATRARAAALLPGGHAVRLVTESRWIQVPLQVPTIKGR